MRIALVTPYSWTYEGGVNRHVEALAEQYLARGHDARVLAPWDPPDRLSRTLHRAPASAHKRPDYLIPLGRTIGVGANGAVSNLSPSPNAVIAMRRELRAGRYDVIHVHEPVGPLIGWDAVSFPDTPVVGTFHAYSTKLVPNQVGEPVRSAPQAQLPAGADRRLRGGGVDRPALSTAASTGSCPTASTSRPRRRVRSHRPKSSGSSSSVAPRSARASRSC